ncbi:MAG: CAP domain-containing protein [Minisyncoccia bacterium]
MRKRLKNHFVPHEGNDYKPHFARGKNVLVLALLAVFIFNLAFFLNSYVNKHPGLLSAVITAVLVDLTNSNRLTQNISPLVENPTLAYAAQLKANDMAEKSYFAHTSPEGFSPWYWFKKGGYEFLYAGENLAVNFSESSDVVSAWMNSEGHRTNIMNNKFTEIGIAMAPGYYNGRETIYVVQFFGQPAPKQLATIPVTEKLPESTLPPEEEETPTVVASEESEVKVLSENIEVLAETELFIAVENKNYAATAAPQVTNVVPTTEPTIMEKIIASPKTVLEFVYVIIGAIVLISLVFLLVVEPRRQHPKHFAYVASLLVLVVVLFYSTKNYLFSEIIIE